MPDPIDPAPSDDAALWRFLRTPPRVADLDSVRRRCADFVASADKPLLDLLDKPGVDRLVAGIADHSPYLWTLIAADQARFARIMTGDPTVQLAKILAELRDVTFSAEVDVTRRLRGAKQEVVLLIACADLGGVWPLETVMLALSEAADALIGCALRHVLATALESGTIRVANPYKPETACGLVVLATGKLGGQELSYSDRVELIGLYDLKSPAIVSPFQAQSVFVRMMQDLLSLLQRSGADGEALRIDLRSRPSVLPDEAVSLDAAFLHYEALGENRDRASMIKARPVAGDLGLGQSFISGLFPFIWRRYFDFAAIADIHAMKQAIQADGDGETDIAGHNIELGRGGIREIEYFVLTQQLIFGGKRPQLRGSRTLPVLRQLGRDGQIAKTVVTDLTRAYDFLRRIEHRLQLIGNEPIHRLPASANGLRRFALFCGHASTQKFSEALAGHLHRVALHYALLFETSSSDEDPGAGLTFAEADVDESSETLAGLGYKDPTAIVRMVRAWRAGTRSALRSLATRTRLHRLVPKLLVAFSRTSDPDRSVAAFDMALHHMPAAGELFAILAADARLLALFSDVFDSAPRLAAAVTRRPHLLDVAIDQTVTVYGDDATERRIAVALARSRTTEEHLDSLRDVQQEEHFRIGVRLLAGDMALDDAGSAYATLAVGVMRLVLRNVQETFAIEHGRIPGGTLAILAMGALGSREMVATSDLDFVVLYDFDGARPESDGRSPLHATRYYARLTQRLVSHLTVETRRGTLYEVDMGLRPSGRRGPLATTLAAFVPHQKNKAALWEHLALTHARVIAADEKFGQRVADAVCAVLRQRRKPGLSRSIADMRAAMLQDTPPAGDWDLARLPGGLLDLRLIAECLALRHAAERASATALSTQSTFSRAARCGLLDAHACDRLLSAYRLFNGIRQMAELTIGDDLNERTASTAVLDRIAASAPRNGYADLEEQIAHSRRAVRAIFADVLDVKRDAL